MTTFVLVHGAWHGGWCWDAVVQRLEAGGHEVHAPTLTGLGERSHLLSADLTPDTHVADIVQLIRWRGLRDVVLVGHSYGGVVVTGVAGQVPELLAGLIYLDAFAPQQSGVSIFGQRNPERMAAFQKQIDAGAIGVEPDHFHAWSESEETRDWLKTMCTPHPVGCLTKGVTVTGRETEVAHKHFILCAGNVGSAFWEEYDKAGARGWGREKMDCMHDAMVDRPDELSDILIRLGREMSA